MAGFEIELYFFSTLIEKVILDKHGIIALTDNKLNLLARKPALLDLLGEKVNDEIVEIFITSGKNYTSFHNKSTLDGENRLYGVRKVVGLPFIIIVGEAEQDWLRDWRQKTVGTVIIVIIFWILSVLILRNHWKQLKLNQELIRLANTDALTGISNRRDFLRHAEMAIKRIKRNKKHLAVLVLDIDHFKLINDTHGHATGDRAIIGLTKACLESLRDVDIMARLGGDEFAILLPNTNISDARIVAERIRLAIGSFKVFNDSGDELFMTSSIGIAVIDSSILNVDDMMALADGAVYIAKEKGRNRIEQAEQSG